MADYLPKLEREVPKLEREPDRRIREAELLRELAIDHFETAARECMTLCASEAEFEAELRADIARFVQFRVGQYQWLGDAMRSELNAGFTFFIMRANPWAGIPEGERDSRWHVGAIIGEALSHTSLKLIAEATARAAEGNFTTTEAVKPMPTELTVNGGNGTRAAVDAFILKCKTELSVRVNRKHIWRAVGHTTARQFQFWQASDPKATAQDTQNFRRILAMNPTDFEALLKKKGII